MGRGEGDSRRAGGRSFWGAYGGWSSPKRSRITGRGVGVSRRAGGCSQRGWPSRKGMGSHFGGNGRRTRLVVPAEGAPRGVHCGCLPQERVLGVVVPCIVHAGASQRCPLTLC